MPKSRKRKPRNHSAKQARRTSPQQRGDGRRVIANIRPGENIEHLLTAEDRQHMELAMEAAARGDARAALEHHMAGLVVPESLTHHCLHELVQLGSEVPGWMYSRWAVDQTALWMLISHDPRCDEFVRLVLAALHTDRLEELCTDGLALTEYGTLVAATDWAFHQLAVYEGGGLRDFLDAKAEPGLLDLVDSIDDWERAAVTAYELVSLQGDVLNVRRLADDHELELLNLGASTDIGTGSMVVGRVVPVSVWPFAMFESRPLEVDPVTAREVATRSDGDDDLGWLWALASAHEAGRLPAGSTCGHGTLFSTDIIPMRGTTQTPRAERAGRMLELMDAGVSEDAANGVCVAELALIVADVSPDGVGTVAPHLTAVLMDPRVHEALKEHSLDTTRGPLWQVLAGATPSPVRERCLELAVLCETPKAS